MNAIEIIEATKGMTSPVRCRCGGIYDLGTVTVTARYVDCSVWKAPCCGRTADDRQWKSLPDYTPIDRSRVLADPYGGTW